LHDLWLGNFNRDVGRKSPWEKAVEITLPAAGKEF